MDALTVEQRKRAMSRCVGDDLKPESALRAALRAAGVRYVRNDGSLPGTPDLAFHPERLAVFMHGCLAHYRKPKSNRAFWRRKLAANKMRDARVRRALNRLG